MNDNSFSLQFNPVQRIRTVKDYEKEIEDLRNENFELKHQISHYKSSTEAPIMEEDIQRLLFDSKKSIDILEYENEGLSKQIENLQLNLKNIKEEKEKLEIEANKYIQEHLDKIGLLEEENNRLIKHMENINSGAVNMKNDLMNAGNIVKEKDELIGKLKRYIEEVTKEKDEAIKRLEISCKEKDEYKKYEGEILGYKNAILNSNKEIDQLNYERDREKVEYNSKINQLQSLISSYEERLKNNSEDIKKIKEYYENKIVEYENDRRQSKNNDMYFKELSDNYTRETKEKQTIAFKNEELKNEIERLKKIISDLEKKIEILENEKRALSYKVSSDKETGELLATQNKEINQLKREKEKLERQVESKIQEIYFLQEKVNENTNNHGIIFNDKIKYLEDVGRRVFENLEAAKDILKYGYNSTHDSEKIKQIMEDIRRELRKVLSDVRGEIIKNQVDKSNESFLKMFELDLQHPFNEIIRRFKNAYTEIIDKLRIAEKEVNDVTNLATNNNNDHAKTMSLIDSFAREFELARKDLQVCKEYLIKKKEENKELKLEKNMLENKYKSKEKKIRELYENLVDRLKVKEDIISKLEMKVGTRI